MTSTTSHRNKGRKKKKAYLYNQEIDRTVIDALSQANKMSHGQLKREVEKVLGLTIPPRTWSTHLTKMRMENYLLKEDTGKRNTKVFYSLTELAKELRDLKILRSDSERPVFCQIYANLFFRAFVEGNQYADDLAQILNETHVTREELHIDCIKKGYFQYYEEKQELTTIPERRLPVFATIYYKPTSSGIKIVESTTYRENIMYRNRVEYTSYFYTVPGVTAEDLAEKYYTFKPDIEDCKRVLDLLLKRNLILPVMEFRGNTRFVVADPGLRDFVDDLYQFHEVENEFMNVKWQYSTGPTFGEEQSRKIWYSDETKSEKFFNVRELQRHQFKQTLKDNKELSSVQNQLEENLQKFENNRNHYINYIKKKHLTVINKYPFLRELISVVSPRLFQAVKNSPD